MPEPSTPRAAMTPAAAPDPELHLRADARRNRAAILAAAEQVFGCMGADAPVDEVARRAGVGVGTVYRNFPTKEALLRAMVMAHVQPLIEAAHAAAASPDPGGAIFSLLRHLAGEFAAFKPVADAIAASGIILHDEKRSTSGHLLAAVDLALTRAKEAGAVRTDVGTDEVATMMSALCMSDMATRDPEIFQRCVGLVCDGLRPVPGMVPAPETPRAEASP